jgi:hypothetical protein
MHESGRYHDSQEYPYGLMDEAAEEIKLLRSERDAARRMYCTQKSKPEVVGSQPCPAYATAVAFNNKWDIYDK